MLSITTIHRHNLYPLWKKAGIQYSFPPGIWLLCYLIISYEMSKWFVITPAVLLISIQYYYLIFSVHHCSWWFLILTAAAFTGSFSWQLTCYSLNREDIPCALLLHCAVGPWQITLTQWLVSLNKQQVPAPMYGAFVNTNLAIISKGGEHEICS